MTGPERISFCQPEQLLLYHYGELDGAGRLEVEQHLQYCPACRAALVELREVLEALPKVDPELSPAEVQRFKSRVMEQLPPKKSRMSRPALAWSLAGVALLLLTLNLGRQGPTRAPLPNKLPPMMAAEPGNLPDPELLANLDLLENFELVQQLDELR